MDAHNYSTVTKCLRVIGLTVFLLALLLPAHAETEPVSPIPTEWIPAPNPCGGMIPAVNPMQCHSGTYYASFLPVIEG